MQLGNQGAVFNPSNVSITGGLVSNVSFNGSTAALVKSVAVVADAINVNFSESTNFSVTLQATNSQTLNNPTNALSGQSGQIVITQNALPSVLLFGSNWNPVIADSSVSSIAGSITLLTYYVISPTNIWFGLSTADGVNPQTLPAAGIGYSTGTHWGPSLSTSGSGSVVALTDSPSLINPSLGTPASGNLSNCTNYQASNLVGGIPNIAGGATGSIPYQSAADTTSFLPIGTADYVLTSNGTTIAWAAPTGGSGGTATNIAGGATGSIPYQSAADTTSFLPIGTADYVLTSNGTTIAWAAPTGGSATSNWTVVNNGYNASAGDNLFCDTALPRATSTASSISGTTLTVAGTLTGTFKVGTFITGATVQDGTYITALGTGTGGEGTYTVNQSQTVTSSAINGSGSFVVFLPNGSANDSIKIADYRGTFGYTPLVIMPYSGQLINAANAPLTVAGRWDNFTLVYVDSVVGWRTV